MSGGRLDIDTIELPQALRRALTESFDIRGPWKYNTTGRPSARAVDRKTRRLVNLTLAIGLRDPEGAAQRLRALSALDERHIEKLYDVLDCEHGLIYTSEIVEGPDLKEPCLTEDPEPLAIALSLVPALISLHQEGLTHGNVGEAAVRLTLRGRLVLVEPEVEPNTDGSVPSDWMRLGRLLRSRIEREDSALLSFAEDLARGRYEQTSILLRLLELHTESQGRRYQHLGILGVGGMGEVRRVRDPSLDRTVAQKVILNARMSQADIRRFLSEARLTSRLQHPGIAPVHEVGTLPDGRPYFTMKEIEGQTLREAIEEVHAASSAGRWEPSERGWTFRRLVEALRDAADAVAYAHARGVIHRDLKPDNILLGSFGEVHVVDWGLAKEIDKSELPQPTASDEDGFATLAGSVIGTRGYMPPEQESGALEHHDRTSDVYALGASLFHVLVGRAPSPGASRDPAEQVGFGHPEMPEALVALCRRSLSIARGERPKDAKELSKALSAWLDGSQQRARALEKIPEIDALMVRVLALRAEAKACRQRALEAIDGVAPYDPIDKKLPSWESIDRAAEIERQADALHAEYIQHLHSALELSPGLPEAERRLYDDYREQMEAAEVRGDAPLVARYERLLLSDTSGRYAAWLRGDGAITLLTEPAGATVVLRPFEEHLKQLTLGEPRALGLTPLYRAAVPRGSFVLEITHPGYERVTYPIQIGRGELWEGIPPGGDSPATIVLPKVGQLRPGDRLVPAGWFTSGGDTLAPDGLPERKWWVPSMLVREHPVTHGQYVDFLNDLHARGFAAEAARLAPKTTGDGAPIYAQDSGGRYLLQTEVEGTDWGEDWPIVLVDADGAEAYAAWLAERTGEPWRLPHDLEWEKAARGVDKRWFPWGNTLDPTFCCMVQSHKGAPSRVPVHTFPCDTSPYGIRGLAGNVRDLCANPYLRAGLPPDLQSVPELHRTPEQEYCMVKGGSWGSVETWCRSAARFTARPKDRSTSVSFRLFCAPRWLNPS